MESKNFINAEECAALNRFRETCEDGEGYDVPKEMMRRLAVIGAIRRVSGAFYEFTEFGNWLMEATASQPAQGVGLTEDVRKLLQEFVDYHTEPAGMTPGVVRDGERFGAFLKDIEAREKDMVARARAILARQTAPTPPAQAIYQIQATPDSWYDVSRETYEASGPLRRVVCVLPPFAAPASQHDANGRAAVPEGWLKALHAAVGAIYFDDSSDYKAVLWDVVRNLAPELVDELEANPSAVWHKTDPANVVLYRAPSPASVAQEGEQMDLAALIDECREAVTYWEPLRPFIEKFDQQTSAQVDDEGGEHG